MKIIILMLSLILLVGCTTQTGNTKDKVHGYDVGPVWGHLYLINDHSTVYCFDKGLYESKIESAEDLNQTVKVYYNKQYPFNTFLCSAVDGYERVEVIGIEVV